MDIRYKAIQRVFIFALSLNIALAVLKCYIGVQTRSLGVVSDALHSFLDGAASAVGLLAIYMAAQPADEQHPYGHRKFEIIATFILSGLLLLSCWEILGSAYTRLMNPVPTPDFSWAAVLAILATVGINFAFSLYQRRQADALQSPLLAADASHTRSDMYSSILALIGLGTAALGWFWVDAVAAIGIVCIIARAAYLIIQDSIDTVAEANRLDQDEVRSVVEKVAGVENAHAIRSHGMKTDIHLDYISGLMKIFPPKKFLRSKKA
ncbi:MAG: cation transporter [Blastochloris sp.]|nr:cation transporter [Blastochloris sp.]